MYSSTQISPTLALFGRLGYTVEPLIVLVAFLRVSNTFGSGFGLSF